MTTIIGAILAFVFLDPPWRYLLIIALLFVDFLQILVWLRWRKRRAITGHHERLVGAQGETVSECRPFGQVKVNGQLWKAYCPEGIDVAQRITVTDVDGLQLRIAAKATQST
jgi:membrane protein implicated in regulation of membrane protease activity